MIRKPFLLLAVMTTCACGPSWKDVIVHPDGTVEDPKTGECWDQNNVPVKCPEKSNAES
jgi:hypothetical protein